MLYKNRFTSEIADDSTAFATPQNTTQYSFRNKTAFDPKLCSSALSNKKTKHQALRTHQPLINKNSELSVKRPGFVCRNSPKWIIFPEKKEKLKAKLECWWENEYPIFHHPQKRFILYNIIISIYSNWIRLEPYLNHLLRDKSNYKSIEQIKKLIATNLQILQKQLYLKQKAQKKSSQMRAKQEEKISDFSSDYFLDHFHQNLDAIEDIVKRTIYESRQSQKKIKNQLFDGMNIGTSRKIKTIKQNIFAQEILENSKKQNKERKKSGESIIYTSQNLTSLLDTLIDRIQIVKYLTGKSKKIDAQITQPLKKLFQSNDHKLIKTQKLIDDIMEIFKDLRAKSSTNSTNKDKLDEENQILKKMKSQQRKALEQKVQKRLLEGISKKSKKKEEITNQLINADAEIFASKNGSENSIAPSISRQIRLKQQNKRKTYKGGKKNIELNLKQIDTKTKPKNLQKRQSEIDTLQKERQLDKEKQRNRETVRKIKSTIHNRNTSHHFSKKNSKQIRFEKKSIDSQQSNTRMNLQEHSNLLGLKLRQDLNSSQSQISDLDDEQIIEGKIASIRRNKNQRKIGKTRFSLQQNNQPQDDLRAAQLEHEKALADILTSLVQRSMNRGHNKKSTLKFIVHSQQSQDEQRQQLQADIKSQLEQTKKQIRGKGCFKFEWNKEQLLINCLPLQKQVDLRQSFKTNLQNSQNIFKFLTSFNKQAEDSWLGYLNPLALSNKRSKIIEGKQFSKKKFFNIELIEEGEESVQAELKRKRMQNLHRRQFANQTKMIRFSRNLTRRSGDLIGQKGLESEK